jgi:hypothetical protein
MHSKTFINYFALVGAQQVSVVSGIAPFVIMEKRYIFRNISHIFAFHFRFKLNIWKMIYKYYLCTSICVKEVQSSRSLLVLKWSVNFPYIEPFWTLAGFRLHDEHSRTNIIHELNTMN